MDDKQTINIILFAFLAMTLCFAGVYIKYIDVKGHYESVVSGINDCRINDGVITNVLISGKEITIECKTNNILKNNSFVFDSKGIWKIIA